MAVSDGSRSRLRSNDTALARSPAIHHSLTHTHAHVYLEADEELLSIVPLFHCLCSGIAHAKAIVLFFVILLRFVITTCRVVPPIGQTLQWVCDENVNARTFEIADMC